MGHDEEEEEAGQKSVVDVFAKVRKYLREGWETCEVIR